MNRKYMVRLANLLCNSGSEPGYARQYSQNYKKLLEMVEEMTIINTQMIVLYNTIEISRFFAAM